MTPVAELGPIGQRITQKLAQAFAPDSLEVIDESHRHAGHAGAHAEGESHFRVKIVAEAFRGKSRVEQHRMVNGVLAEELKSRVHALAIEAKPPQPKAELAFLGIAADDPRLATLLSTAGLGIDDLASGSFLGIVDGEGHLLACGGLERRGDAVLIRSVAVDPRQRRNGLGATITFKLLAEARNAGAQAAYLLTASAPGFFARLGFQPVERSRVPAPILATGQFSGQACASAQPMVQVLKPL